MDEFEKQHTNNALCSCNISGLPRSQYVYPELLTEEELVTFLRIPSISHAKDYRNVIENLKRMHDLPRIHICGKALYPKDAIKEWIINKTIRK